MKLIDEKLGGTTPLEVILKFPEKKNENDDDDEFEDWEMKIILKMMKNIGLPKIKLIKLLQFIII